MARAKRTTIVVKMAIDGDPDEALAQLWPKLTPWFMQSVEAGHGMRKYEVYVSEERLDLYAKDEGRTSLEC